jgi:hypothetical protein
LGNVPAGTPEIGLEAVLTIGRPLDRSAPERLEPEV